MVKAPETSLQYWTGNGSDQGGSGTWAAGKAWDNTTAGTTDLWPGQTGIFGGQAGTVILEGSQAFQTLEFLTDGYAVAASTNGALDLSTRGRLWIEGVDITTMVAAPFVSSGTLNKIGAGTLIMSGDNGYDAGTVLVGMVSVSADGNLGAASGGVTLAGGGLSASASFTSARNVTITGSTGDIGFAGGQTLTLVGTISGTGTLVKQDEGTLILTGDHNYAGGTTIRASILQIGNGGATGSILGDVVNEGTLIFDRSGSYRFPATVTGSGDVLIRSGGTVDFGGGYEGAIKPTDSALRIADGSSTVSQFTVGTGGVLGGNGAIGGLIVREGGTAAPGNSPGTINVNGNVLFEAGSTY